LIYLIKTILLLANKNEGLAKFTKVLKVPEMIISALFLLTGIYMLTQIPEIKTLMIIKIVAVFVSIPIAIIGFKKKNKALAVLSFLLIVGAYGMAEVNKKQKSKALQGITESNISGKELYEAACISCHGADGKLGIMGARNFSESTMDLSARIEIIKKGKVAMKPFGGILTDEQIKAVAEYTETLK
jgi:cytochrome c553